ncbi:MAG: (d)CMP kinase [Verrucomicrobia bacterium]|nr:(d)CMP kinase [Verrucomicrobiota bacterium]MCG2680197.1 (d)CMP kinase [Kiritimatiellia bacterium]MBU4247515.1 (d)CMP kinase [Verrucomicrobiota bacterium]MBU4289484.1 (d)CMP kinase [Verrucomicrobiota bacterium]MBU4427721.1 (d)CMP kinase [Verrucomicrobiota bacterium]
MSTFIIAIDGPAASGKSTVSRRVAAALHWVHVDSGSLYRGVTWKLLRDGLSCRDEQVVMKMLMSLRMEFFLVDGGIRFMIDGEDPGMKIRSEQVAEQVSVVAAMPCVRAWIGERLRSMLRFGSLAMEGRDIGTVVFPDAPFKFFLNATPEERARRRLGDLSGAEGTPSFSKVKTSLLRRDALDSERAAAPLARAADARVIDTTGLSIDDVVAQIVNAVRKTEPRSLVYRICRFLLKVWLVLWCRFESRGEQQVPPAGGCILASNHASFLDPPLVGCNLAHRFIRFMARDTLFRNPVFSWWGMRVGVVMLDRTKGDIGAMKAALAVLKAGGILCLFPEGTRTRDGELQPPKGGIGFLIAKARVPVVPVYVDGSFRAFPRGARWVQPRKITVHYGAPLYPDAWSEMTGSKDGYERIAALVMERISVLERKARGMPAKTSPPPPIIASMMKSCENACIPARDHYS